MTASRSTTKGKVVLVPFPFDDLSSTKVRPAVCLTEPVGPHRHVVLGFITSQAPPDPQPTDIVLSPTTPGFAVTSLRVTSTLRLHRLMAVTTTVIRRELGSLPAPVQAQVTSALRLLFGL